MSHTPFIVGSYLIALVLLGWCALAPVLRGRKMKRFILSRNTFTESEDASDS
jgi:hypothetical protein